MGWFNHQPEAGFGGFLGGFGIMALKLVLEPRTTTYIYIFIHYTSLYTVHVEVFFRDRIYIDVIIYISVYLSIYVYALFEGYCFTSMSLLPTIGILKKSSLLFANHQNLEIQVPRSMWTPPFEEEKMYFIYQSRGESHEMWFGVP